MENSTRVKIAEIIKNGVTYSAQTDSIVIHGAIDEIEKLIEAATLYERDKRKLWNDENNNLIKELGRRDGRIHQLEAERSELRTIEDVVKAFEAGKLAGQSELRNKVIEEAIEHLNSPLLNFSDGLIYKETVIDLLNSLKTK